TFIFFMWILFTLQFFGTEYNKLYVNNNGFLTFGQAVSSPYSSMFRSGYDIIAPFWSNWNTTKSGVISYLTSGSVLEQATSDLHQYFPELNFTATWVFIVTWNVMEYYPTMGNVSNTIFQVVLVSDGHLSFIMMNYGNLVGYDTINSTNYFSMPESFESNITSLSFTSNVNVTGRWVFRTDSCPNNLVSDCVCAHAFFV
uniref:NIDO domain-containing protein n=1 Tax=Scleropages formosus TaxID=113540 RepID=A0A8C9U0A3_SCLFO